MIASAHVLAGAVAAVAVARVVGNRVARIAGALVLGFYSHLWIDVVPHSDYQPLPQPVIPWVALLESLAACTLVWFVVRRHRPAGPPDYLLAGIAAAVVVDAKSVAALLLPARLATLVRDFGYRIHEGAHASPPVTLLAGWLADLGVTLLLLMVLLAVTWGRVTLRARSSRRRSAA